MKMFRNVTLVMLVFSSIAVAAVMVLRIRRPDVERRLAHLVDHDRAVLLHE